MNCVGGGEGRPERVCSVRGRAQTAESVEVVRGELV
jgi:hypothetical protein